MAKGVLYCMTTVVPGLIKIGKTKRENYESRMYGLERHGYSNVVGLKRHFAIEVEDCDAKEVLLGDIFNKSRVPNSELFALDIDLVVQLLSSFDGKQIYPLKTTKHDEFKKAVEQRKVKEDLAKIPDGTYYLNHQSRKGFGQVTATMRVEHGHFIVEKGCRCLPTGKGWIPEARQSAIIKDDILQEDVDCNSPSTATWIPMGRGYNGWEIWKDKNGNPLDIQRKK